MNLPQAGLFVDAPLASRLPLEMLHGIRHIDAATVDAGLVQALVEQFAGWADERMAFLVFGISGLLADHHQIDLGPAGCGLRLYLAEDRLRRVAVEIAAMALLHRLAE